MFLRQHAPRLLVVEVANIAVKRVRRRQLDVQTALDFLAALDLLGIECADVSADAAAHGGFSTRGAPAAKREVKTARRRR